MTSHLDKLEEAAALLCSVTDKEVEEIPERRKEQLSYMAAMIIGTRLNLTHHALTVSLAQTYILGQRSAIPISGEADED